MDFGSWVLISGHLIGLWACNLTPLHQPPRLIAVPTPYKCWKEIRWEGLYIINSWKISHIILLMEKCWGLLKQDGDTSSYTVGQGHNFFCNLWIKNLLQKSMYFSPTVASYRNGTSSNGFDRSESTPNEFLKIMFLCVARNQIHAKTTSVVLPHQPLYQKAAHYIPN